MNRLPIQILVFPYYCEKDGVKYCLFKRKDMKIWQGIAGGAEKDETVEMAAKRETYEEAGIKDGKLVCLETVCSMPSISIKKEFLDENILIVVEKAFGIEVRNKNIKISDEHTQYKWFDYNEANKNLFWDSNKTALWELNYRITHKF